MIFLFSVEEGGTAWGDPNGGGFGQMFFSWEGRFGHMIFVFCGGGAHQRGREFMEFMRKKHNNLSLQQFGKTIVEIDDDASA